MINWTAPIAANERVWLGNNGVPGQVPHFLPTGRRHQRPPVASSPCAPLCLLRLAGFRIMRLVGTEEENLASLVATLGLFVPELTQPVGCHFCVHRGYPRWPRRTGGHCMHMQVWSSVAEYNAAFLRSKAFYTLEHRNVTDVIPDASQIQDGDFFGILRLDGLDPMLGWAMGAHTGKDRLARSRLCWVGVGCDTRPQRRPRAGHTTIALRFDGELYICESTDKDSYWPNPGIQRTPYTQASSGKGQRLLRWW
jgi:hypothetical protein